MPMTISLNQKNHGGKNWFIETEDFMNNNADILIEYAKK